MKIKVYFDYLCPYCYRGQANFDKLLEKHPDWEPEWVPCEAHPRPEPARVHSDIAIMGCAYLQEHGGDINLYNHLVFAANFEEGKNIEDTALLAEFGARCGADAAAMKQAIEDKRYQGVVDANNRLTWETQGFEAVPSYSVGEAATGSAGGVLISPEAIERFVEAHG